MFLLFCHTDNTDSTDICCFAAFFVSSVFLDVLFYWFEVCIGLVGVEDLVAVHHRDEVFRVAEVDDVVGIARQHVYALDVVASHLELNDLIGAKLTLLDEAVTAHHNEELPLGVVPMLALGNARLGNINRNLATIQCMDQFGEAATVVNVHLQREGDLLLREIREIRGVQLLGETIIRYLRNQRTSPQLRVEC